MGLEGHEQKNIEGNDIRDVFFHTCNFLDRCGRYGITLNPNKFQFGKENVDFEITSNLIKPNSKLVSAIRDFPTPTDITGVRSWFGFVNQVSYAYYLTDELNPYRELLKPKNKFHRDEQIQTIFERSKKKIIENVRNGVKIFDQMKKTCLRLVKNRNWVHSNSETL